MAQSTILTSLRFALVYLVYIRYIQNLMLLVESNNSNELNLIEEEFQKKGNYFEIPFQQAGTLEALIRSISFQFFQNKASTLVQKIISYIENSLNHVVSLTLLREIFTLLHQVELNMRKYQQYYADIGKIIGQNQQIRSQLKSDDISLQELNDHLFQLAKTGQIRMTRNLDCPQFYQHFEENNKPKCLMNISQKTQIPYSYHLNPEKYENKQTLDESQHIKFNFYPTNHNDYTNEVSNQWWKNDKNNNDSSKQISKFICKGQNLINQKSIGHLISQELKYELNREMQFGRNINKHKEIEQFKYKKLMKEKLMNAKLKKRKKN